MGGKTKAKQSTKTIACGLAQPSHFSQTWRKSSQRRSLVGFDRDKEPRSKRSEYFYINLRAQIELVFKSFAITATTEMCDEIISCIRRGYLHNFANVPEEVRFKITMPASRDLVEVPPAGTYPMISLVSLPTRDHTMQWICKHVQISL